MDTQKKLKKHHFAFLRWMYKNYGEEIVEASFTKMASEYKISYPTARKYIQRLEDNGCVVIDAQSSIKRNLTIDTERCNELLKEANQPLLEPNDKDTELNECCHAKVIRLLEKSMAQYWLDRGDTAIYEIRSNASVVWTVEEFRKRIRFDIDRFGGLVLSVALSRQEMRVLNNLGVSRVNFIEYGFKHEKGK